MDQDSAAGQNHPHINHGNGSAVDISDANSDLPIYSLRIKSAPWICLVLAFLSNLASRLIQVPLLRICELGACRKYYATHDPSLIDSRGNVEERFCKLDSVQQNVAYIVGLLGFIPIIIELVELIPFGILSDRYGRKLFIFLQAFSAAASSIFIIIVGSSYEIFPFETILLLPIFAVVSGGDSIAAVNLFAILADCIQDESHKTRLFAYLNATSQVLLLLGPVIASSAMSVNLFFPIWMSVVVNFLAAFTVGLLPDTRLLNRPQSNHSQDPQEPTETQPLLPQPNGSHDHMAPMKSGSRPFRVNDEDDETCLSGERVGFTDVLCTAKRKLLVELEALRSFALANRNVRLCLLVLLVTRLGSSSIEILIQYVSIRYGWTYAQAGYLFSIKAAVSLTLFLIIIPLGLSTLTRRHISKPLANHVGMKLSIVALGVGALSMSASIKIWMFIIGLAIFVLGSGLALFIQSLLSSPEFIGTTDQPHARTYSVLFFVERVGMLISTPVLTGSWAAAIKMGGFKLGLPFLLCAVSYSIVGLMVWNMRA